MKVCFWVSGFFALIIETCIFFVVFFALLPKVQKQYIFQEKTTIEFMQIEEIKKKDKPKQTSKIKAVSPKKIEQKQAEQKKIEKSNLVSSPKVGSNLRKLFEKVDSSNPPIREEQIEDDRPKFSANTLRRQQYAFQQSDTQIKEETSRIRDTLDSLWEKELEVSSPPQDISDGEYDEWFAKIKEILYAKWVNSFYESVAITVNIVIEADGRFRFKIIKYSKNYSYNAYMEELLEELKNEKFPPYPKGEIALEVVFKTKEHDDE